MKYSHKVNKGNHNRYLSKLLDLLCLVQLQLEYCFQRKEGSWCGSHLKCQFIKYIDLPYVWLKITIIIT